MFVFGPVQIAVASENVLDSRILVTVTSAFFIGSLLLAFCVFLLKKKYIYVEILLTAILALIVVNFLFFPFQAGVLDGRSELIQIGGDIKPLLRNIFALLLSITMVALFRKHLRFIPIILLVCVIIFTGNGIRVMQARSVNIDDSKKYQVIESATTFSTNQNIIVIVFDAMQGSMVERVFLKYPHLQDSFNGFTLFTRAFSSFPFTAFSRQNIQSGQLYVSDNTNFLEQRLVSISDSFMTDMQEHGMRVNAIGAIDEIVQQEEVEIPFISGIAPRRPWASFGIAVAASMARITGYWMPNPFAPTIWEGNLNLLQDSVYTFNMLLNNASAYGEQGKLLYLWDLTLHSPVSFSRDGQMIYPLIPWQELVEQNYIDEYYFVFTQLVHLFETMEQLGVYDNSLIILLSDHGDVFPVGVWEEHVNHAPDFTEGGNRNGNFWWIQAYNSSMLIKPPNASGQAIITHNPAWNGDVRAIINHYFHNFDNHSPIDVMAEIRVLNPEVGVMFAPYGTGIMDVYITTELHEIVYVASLHDIPAAFAAHSASATD